MKKTIPAIASSSWILSTNYPKKIKKNLLKYFFRIRTRRQSTFFRPIPSNDVMIPILMLLQSRMQLIMTFFTDSDSDILLIINMM